ncbi:hypothetical protein [Pseudomonas fragi]|uniref:hypothetical protein n=1 Tax=Pseudomonas fragi TaxID=296 RepID=UPI002D778158|nr:hypothetical protein [Pseudomonas fragi]WRT62658.1 hypothetical protein VK847_10230 [Pseudomonas fragi]
MKTKKERLDIIFHQLSTMPPVSDRNQANTLICNVVNEVENKETNLPLDYNPNSGRMFFYSFSPTIWENLESDPARLYLNSKHIVEIFNNGTIIIYRKQNDGTSEVFRKTGV